ncbi:hypothetical protein ACDP63_08415 [Paracoccus sp. P2]|uniref:Uncharacterized protein n=1 Tax=Paracoccus pantotrophus TaxID=82367 RepID=A0A7H9BV78_PARPN|nr:hypothetical protein [Paracoccus pantotrophus]MDF3854993.1 hypothetical protein [Paracoccus pantotrophus]QLH14775.1 hypothetical protein HYQ43_10770 [Paracoccus pantotrophus]WGR64904.1 hypothetical protein E3U24_06150 [Paracoccus pantotrophus]
MIHRSDRQGNLSLACPSLRAQPAWKRSCCSMRGLLPNVQVKGKDLNTRQEPEKISHNFQCPARAVRLGKVISRFAEQRICQPGRKTASGEIASKV